MEGIERFLRQHQSERDSGSVEITNDNSIYPFLIDELFRYGLRELLLWFLAPPQATRMRATYAYLMPTLGRLAVEYNQLEILELLLTSDVFVGLSEVKQLRVLSSSLCRVHADISEDII